MLLDVIKVILSREALLETTKGCYGRSMSGLPRLLDASGIPTFVSATEDRMEPQGLASAQALLAFCFDDYGEKTGGFDSYEELKSLGVIYKIS